MIVVAGCGGGSHQAKTSGTARSGAATASTRSAGTGTGTTPVKYVNTARAERLIAQQVDAQRHQKVGITCPANVPLQVGHQFICRAAIPSGAKILLVVTVLDPAGRLHFTPAGS